MVFWTFSLEIPYFIFLIVPESSIFYYVNVRGSTASDEDDNEVVDLYDNDIHSSNFNKVRIRERRRY